MKTWLTGVCLCVFSFSDAAPRLLQENQKYLSQLTSLMQEAADEQAKSIVVSPLLLSPNVVITFAYFYTTDRHKCRTHSQCPYIYLTDNLMRSVQMSDRCIPKRPSKVLSTCLVHCEHFYKYDFKSFEKSLHIFTGCLKFLFV